MKKIAIILIISFIILIANIFELIYGGFFRDIYTTVNIDIIFVIFFWISLLISILIFVIVYILFLKRKKHESKFSLLVVFSLILAITNIHFGYQYYNVTKKYDLQQKNDVDYISSPFFRGISFDELQADIHSDEEIMIYVGREDCGKCKEFEEEFEKILEQYDTEIPAYYTTQDRFQERRKEMYQYLDRYHIEKVPVIILTQDSEILRMWYDPVNSIPEIIQYL